ncbi:phosphoglucosamine mutase [Actinotignum urinale]|uniref:Phosphoglucosamine mutase n=1 Tax=Actinotignum urinale TaxID=190146 RepID=A0AAW9HWP8_9ACTO|nr:phosphoglucosamine mutase [Actinotignum urinale]MDY5129040.1 phosphoglucosamine mutase [Actinotignum urinale]MDY5132726.1 phosphoglucosamine mutase [Actinotignum urinale]MDY5150974.1 phosphoglucosamine mutase [Actinotignum urinale]MDY5154840.1 phosphoglucosamine mutase [Actinotignum urinale]MDY5159865.1 phosphoglucosamine mutase [Actinotignum urinale]
MPRLFGTDGVRGLANRALTAELALKLGEAAARVLTRVGKGDNRPRAVIGQDSRISGSMLAQAVAAGMAGAGVDVEHVDVIPTPGIAFLTADGGYDMGVMISASHNPMQDNGIKFFAKGGFKLADNLEDEIERILGKEWGRPTGAGIGHIRDTAEAGDSLYIKHLLSAVKTPLEGLNVVVDCANGATSKVAPVALRKAGANVIVINAEPNGYNINDACGSTHPEALQRAVVENQADCGFGYDGDADRCLAVDHEGNLVDGDQIMALLAIAAKEEGKLPNDTLVVTVMSNLGLTLAMKKAGITIVPTAVGDRYVLEEMVKNGYVLGGEQSGHVISLSHATTGDGTLTSLLISQRLAQTGKSLKELASVVQRLPQTLVNVPNVDKVAANTNEQVQRAVRDAEKELGETGRVLLRPSGTEPLVRVMVEAATQEQAENVAGRLAKVVAKNLVL